jgi:type IV pilus assembly protein PilC
MATYAYVAKDRNGRVERGSSDAENDKMLARRLQEQGYHVMSIKAAKGGGAGALAVAPTAGAPAKAGAKKRRVSFNIFGRVSGRDLSIFCRQFSTMINAGVTLVRCLTVLEEQTNSARLKQIIREIQYAVEGGETLSRALQRFPRVFSGLFIGLVRAGEVGGVLDETLNRLATFLEEDQKLRRKVKASMTYPTVVIIFAITIVTFLVTFILPKFMQLFKDLEVGDKLPAPTRMLMNTSNFMKSKWWLIGIIVVAILVAFNQYVRTKSGKRNYDWVKLRLPVFGRLNHMIAIARFSRTLGTLLVSGVPILQALETVASAIDNVIIGEAIMSARAAIREGERIGDPLEKSGMFPPMVVQMISIGEETGSLDSMLHKIAEFYESEVDAMLQSLTAALEPLLIVGLGFIVGFIVISMFLPLVTIISSLSEAG